MAANDPTGVLWSLRAKRSTAKCVLHLESRWIELVVLQDDEIAFREAFPDESTARIRAAALHERLLRKGWTEAG